MEIHGAKSSSDEKHVPKKERSDASLLYRYNKAQIKTRNSVERAFGVWKRRFPCLDMKFQHKPVPAARIIIACAALHNLGLARKEPQPPASRVPVLDANRRTGQPRHLPAVTGRDSRLGAQERHLLIQRSFS